MISPMVTEELYRRLNDVEGSSWKPVYREHLSPRFAGLFLDVRSISTGALNF